MDTEKVMQLVVTQDEPDVAKLTIYGDITDDSFFALLLDKEDPSTTGGLDIVKALSELSDDVKTVEVHINSYGGEVMQGVAIYNALRDCGREVVTVCDGFACSIASVIFMAGSRRIMRPASLLMLHNPWIAARGNAQDLRKQADTLDTIAELSKTAYMTGTSIERETLDAVMDAETWVSPERAFEWGLATEVSDSKEADTPTQSARETVMAALLLTNVDIPKQTSKPAPIDPEPKQEPKAAQDQGTTETHFQRLARIFGDN